MGEGERKQQGSVVPLWGKIIAGVIVLGSLPYLWWFWLVVAMAWLARLLWKWLRRFPYSLEQVDQMNGPQFEQFLVLLFRRMDCRAVHTGKSGDFGADLILESRTERVAVQAKNYDSGTVGNEAVQQAVAAASYYHCDGAMVVTNSNFTGAAMEQARGSSIPVSLIDRKALGELIDRVR